MAGTTLTEQRSLVTDRVRLPRCVRLTSQYNKVTQTNSAFMVLYQYLKLAKRNTKVLILSIIKKSRWGSLGYNFC